MRIFSITMTLVSPPFDDGPKNLAYGIAMRLRRRKFIFVSFLFSKFNCPDNVVFIPSPFQNKPSIKMSFLQQAYILLVILFNWRNIDVFQFFFTPRRYFSLLCKFALRKGKKKSVQIVSSMHSVFSRCPAKGIKSLFFADKVVALSDFSKKNLEERGVKNVVRIYPGVDFQRFDRERAGSDFFGLSGGRQFLYAAYPGAYRVLNLSYSFQEFYRIMLFTKNNIPSVKFVLACKVREKNDFILEEKFRKKINECGMGDSVLFYRTVDDMPALLNSCDLIFFPSYGQLRGILEIPLVLLEAAALEKPVVYSFARPLDELKMHSIGVCLEDYSPESYGRTIADLLKNRDKSRQVGIFSRRGVSENFNLDNTALEFDKIYERLS